RTTSGWQSRSRMPSGMKRMQIRQLNHVALHVNDLEASVRFYRDVLNLRPMQRPAFDFPGAWFEIAPAAAALPPQELHIIAREPENNLPPRERHFAMLVDSMDETARHLRDRQI